MSGQLADTLSFISLRILGTLSTRTLHIPNQSSVYQHIYSIDDDIEFLFYSLVHVLYNRQLTWEKGLVSSLYELKFAVMYGCFDRQLSHACMEKCRPIMQEFHQMLFGMVKRNGITIDEVIESTERKIESCTLREEGSSNDLLSNH